MANAAANDDNAHADPVRDARHDGIAGDYFRNSLLDIKFRKELTTA